MKSRTWMWISVVSLLIALSMSRTIAAQEQPDPKDGTSSLGTTGSVWIVDNGSNTVTKLRSSDGALLGTFNVGHAPVGAAFDGNNIWVSNSGDNTVTKLRGRDGKLLGTFAVGANPGEVAFGGTFVWVLNLSDHTVTKLRATDGFTVATFPLPRGGYHQTSNGLVFDGVALWVAVSYEVMRLLWVADVVKLRASDGQTLLTEWIRYDTLRAVGDIAFDGFNVWGTATSKYNHGFVTKVRASDGKILGGSVFGTSASAITSGGTSMWVVDYVSNNVVKLRTSDAVVLGTFPSGGSNPAGVAFDGSNVWVSNNSSNTVVKLRGTDGKWLGTFAVGSSPYGVVFASVP
jgi:hypothetical protein